MWGALLGAHADRMRVGAGNPMSHTRFSSSSGTGPTWCCTGTPVQNQIKDLFSLVKLIGVPPFQDFAYFRNRVLQPLKYGGDVGITNLRILFGNLALRRVKGLMVKDARGIEQPLIQLPAKVVRVITIEQTDTTKLLYLNLFKQSQTAAMVLLESKNQYGNFDKTFLDRFPCFWTGFHALHRPRTGAVGGAPKVTRAHPS